MAPPSKKMREETPAAAYQSPHQILPDEVIEDIFMRLPAKSAARCRCLSRSWAAVLSSRGFISRHLAAANRRRSRLSFPAALSVWSREHPDAKPLTRSSCRGLGLLKSSSASVVYVCNPSTGQVVSLPDGTPTAKGEGIHGRGHACFGLGYDARAGRHKVVRVYYQGGGGAAGCEVYDVGGAASTGYWRPAASGAKAPCFVFAGVSGAFAQGHVHWLATAAKAAAPNRYRSRADSVVSFSLGDETFASTPLPPSACASPVYLLELTALDGGRRLRLVAHRRHRSRSVGWRPRHTWILGEDNGAGGMRSSPRCWLATDHGGGGGGHDLYEESLEPVGRPHEDILFASASVRALSMALRRLSARALVRIKLVCRSWRAVIESDRFAVSHNEHHRRAAAASPIADRVVFTCCPPYHPKLVLVPLGSCLASDLEVPPLMCCSRVLISKPCHGLAFAISDGYGYLFNPAIRAYRSFLVGISFDVPDCEINHLRKGSIGLGYDRSRQEHVLVLLYAGSPSRGRRMECKVWRLRDDDEARSVPAPPVPVDLDVSPVYIDDDDDGSDDGGRIYWMCRSPRAILAFGILSEAFDVVPAPPPMGSSCVGDGSTEVLVELQGALRVVQSCPSTATVTIWSPSAAGGGGEWAREHVMQLQRWPEFSPKPAEPVIPMAVEPNKDGGRILLDTGRSLGWYDLVRRTVETVFSLRSRLKLPGDHGLFAAALWEESLVRPYDRGARFL
jgi:F-box interacting protein